MSFDWEDFLKVAEILHEGATDAKFEEAMFRIAISRAYYTAFNMAKNRKIAQGVIIALKDSHRFVIDLYSDSEDANEEVIGHKLRRLRQRRNKADYDNEISEIEELSRLSLKEARKILDALAKLK